MVGDNQFNTEKLTSNFSPFVLLTIIVLGSCCASRNESTFSDNTEPIPPEFRGFFRTQAEQIEFERKVSLAKAEIAEIETKKHVDKHCIMKTQWYKMGKITNFCGIENLITEFTTLENVCRREEITKESHRVCCTWRNYVCHREALNKELMSVVFTNESHHGCCVSKTIHICPKTACDINFNEVTLVEYGGRLQIFESETCERTNNKCPLRHCPDCNCELEWTTRKAVVYDSQGRKVVREILIPDKCKCRNC